MQVNVFITYADQALQEDKTMNLANPKFMEFNKPLRVS